MSQHPPLRSAWYGLITTKRQFVLMSIGVTANALSERFIFTSAKGSKSLAN